MPADLLTGSVVAYGLFFLFSSLILYANFPIQWENPGKRAPDADPATYLKVALELFSAMIVTGGVVTLRYSGIDFATTELMHWYGYNNVCVVFDDPPASYICPVYWVLIAYFAVKYCIADTARVYSLTSISVRMRKGAYLVNCSFAFVVCFFAVCLGVGPKENMYLHTTPFLCLVIVLPLVHLLHLAQWKHPTWYSILVVLFTAASLIKVTFTGYALQNPGHPLPSQPARLADTTWVFLALLSSFLMMPAPRPGLSEESNVTVMQATLMQYVTLPLALLYVFYVPVVMVYYLTISLLKRTAAACGLVGKPPDTDTPSHQIKGLRAAKLPVYSTFVGDILGYIGMMKGGWKPLYEGAQRLGTGAIVAGLGRPWVVLTGADALETAQALRDNSTSAVAKWQTWLFEGMDLFSGLTSPKMLKFHFQICAKDPKGAEFAQGIAALRAELASWCVLHSEDRLNGLDSTELLLRASVSFASAFLLGGVIDVELVGDLYPYPANLPLFPWLPFANVCLPGAAKARVVREKLYEQMKAMPRWPDVRQLATAAGLNERQALGDVLSIILLNADGLSNPWTNALAILKILPLDTLTGLAADKSKREALAWELMRFNGPRSAQVATKDVQIPDGGNVYSIKKGTRILGILGLAQMDETVYADPWVFKPERFAPPPPVGLTRPAGGHEPFPTMGQGLKFGGLADETAATAKCVCPFVKLTHPVILAFVEMLLFDFEYEFADTKSRGDLSQEKQALLSAGGIDMSPARLQTTVRATDFALASKSGGAFDFKRFAARSAFAPVALKLPVRKGVCATGGVMF